MRLVFRCCVLLCLIACLATFALQQPQPPQGAGGGGGGRGGGRRGDAAADNQDVTLPNGTSQKDAILKAEYQQNLKDAADLMDLAEQLKLDLEKNDRFVVSMATIKKTDEIEKLAKRIRARLRH